MASTNSGIPYSSSASISGPSAALSGTKCALCPLHIRAPFRHCLVGELFRSAASSTLWKVDEQSFGKPVCCSHFAHHLDCTHPVCDTLAGDGAASQSLHNKLVEAQNDSRTSTNGAFASTALLELSSLENDAKTSELPIKARKTVAPSPLVQEAPLVFTIVTPSSVPSSNPYDLFEGSIIRMASTGYTYRINNNMKHWFPNEPVYISQGRPAYRDVTDEILNSIPTAPAYILPYGLTDGQVIRDPIGNVYRLVLGRKCYYPNTNIYRAHGSPAFVNISADKVAMIPLGPDYE